MEAARKAETAGTAETAITAMTATTAMPTMATPTTTTTPTAQKARASGPGTTRDSLRWALLVPGAATAAGFLAQFPYGGLYVGVTLMLAAAATGAIVAGSNWHRGGAATIAGFGVMALGLFAGPSLYESYAKLLGERTGAVVVLTGERGRDTGEYFCHVIDDGGRVSELGNRQNCYGDFAAEQRVVLYEDPLGALSPWIEAEDDRSLDPVGLAVTAGLFLLVGGTLFTAGLRRRSDQDLLDRHRRRPVPPQRSAVE
ncbi:hypothetical protein SAVIM338S_03229 [Streptomyces avidinii]